MNADDTPFGPLVRLISKPNELQLQVRCTLSPTGWRVLSTHQRDDLTAAAEAARAARQSLLEGETP